MKYVVRPKGYYQNVDEKLSHAVCSQPFKYLEILARGETCACCIGWLPINTGKVTDNAPDMFENFERKYLQSRMLKGVFNHCNDKCPFLNSYLTTGKFNNFVRPREGFESTLESIPFEVMLSYEESCNLYCPSCRNGLIHQIRPNLEIHNKVVKIINYLAQKEKEVIVTITGTGDPFASALFWKFITDYADNGMPDNLFLSFKTNGVLMDKQRWERIKPIWSHIKTVNVSVDAGFEETYIKIRRGGNWGILNKNLNLLDEMIMNGDFPNLAGWNTNMIIQKGNFRDMKQYILNQLKYASKPLISAIPIIQWGHILDLKFEDMAIWKPTHPQYGEFVDMLQDPIFDNPLFDFQDLEFFRHGAL